MGFIGVRGGCLTVEEELVAAVAQQCAREEIGIFEGHRRVLRFLDSEQQVAAQFQVRFRSLIGAEANQAPRIDVLETRETFSDEPLLGERDVLHHVFDFERRVVHTHEILRRVIPQDPRRFTGARVFLDHASNRVRSVAGDTGELQCPAVGRAEVAAHAVEKDGIVGRDRIQVRARGQSSVTDLEKAVSDHPFARGQLSDSLLQQGDDVRNRCGPWAAGD